MTEIDPALQLLVQPLQRLKEDLRQNAPLGHLANARGDGKRRP